MLCTVLRIAIFVLTSPTSVSAQVQTVGDVSFAVLDGWNFQPRRDRGSVTMKADSRFWVVAVNTPPETPMTTSALTGSALCSRGPTAAAFLTMTHTTSALWLTIRESIVTLSAITIIRDGDLWSRAPKK